MTLVSLISNFFISKNRFWNKLSLKDTRDILFNISVLLDVQAILPETSPFFVSPNGFGEHLFFQMFIVLVMHNFGWPIAWRQYARVSQTLCFDLARGSIADNHCEWEKLKSNKIILPKSSPNKLFRFDIFLEILQQQTKWNNHQGQGPSGKMIAIYLTMHKVTIVFCFTG